MPDDTDHRILALITQRPFDSFEKIGKKVSLTGTAVKSRIDALIADGVLEGIRGIPAPSVFGRHARIYHFPAIRPDPDLLAKVVRTDPVVVAGLHHDSVLGVLAFVKEPDAGPPAELTRLLGDPSSTTEPFVPAPSDSDVVPSSMDLKVMRHLIRELRTPPGEIARRTGLSHRTVRRVRERLVEKGLLQPATNLQSARSPGMILYWALVFLTDEGAARAVEKAYPGAPVTCALKNPPGRILLCRARTLGEVVEQKETARQVPGVADVIVVMDLLLAFSASRLEGWVDQELQKWMRLRLARPAGAASRVARVPVEVSVPSPTVLPVGMTIDSVQPGQFR